MSLLYGGPNFKAVFKTEIYHVLSCNLQCSGHTLLLVNMHVLYILITHVFRPSHSLDDTCQVVAVMVLHISYVHVDCIT